MTAVAEAVYGRPPARLAPVGSAAQQVSPLEGEAAPLESLPSGSIARFTVLAPPGAIERRFVLGHALRALASSGRMIALAPKALGGSRLAGDLRALGCAFAETAKAHHRICTTIGPGDPAMIAHAITEGCARLDARLGLWTQPGVFSWDRVDTGSALLLDHLSGLTGRGADFGCGVGVLMRALLEGPAVSAITGLEIDNRALECARRNLTDPRAVLRRIDLTREDSGLSNLDFVVMNPPFHIGGHEDRGLGVKFISAAAAALRRDGVLRLVANVALPYEAALDSTFRSARLIARRDGFKVLEATK